MCDACRGVQRSLLRLISIIGKKAVALEREGKAALEVLSEFSTNESEGAGAKYIGEKGCACPFLTVCQCTRVLHAFLALR